MAATGNLDRRRINAPDTFAPRYLTSLGDASAGPSKTSKTPATDRRLFIQTGLVSQASGSAYLESACCKVACSVFGPRQQSSTTTSAANSSASAVLATGASTVGGGSASRSYHNEAELTVDVRLASFATPQRLRAGKGTESATLANAVRLALLPSICLDRLPKASIDVFITILEANAGRTAQQDDQEACAAAAATAASCALADAGIEIYGLVVGLHGILTTSAQIVVDATHAQAQEARGSLTLWSMPALGTVTSLDQTGGLTIEQVEQLMDHLQSDSVKVHLQAAKAIQEGFLARRKAVEGA